ncbi:Integrase [Lachnospiraceae bacterium JC7]|nr:Integrase [Lachnospiraceae bacterium JC7]
MPVYKNDKNGTWYAMVRYKDWQGNNKQKCQRGFQTKREAAEWEAQFKLQKSCDVDMTLESFYDLYVQYIKPRIKLNTWLTKEVIYTKKILPYFGKRKVSEITATDIMNWQNEMMSQIGKDGKPYSQTYLKTIHAELSALFNFATKYYELRINPARLAGTMGMEESKEMSFWTKEEYLKFAEAIMDKPISYYAFEILYWCGVREGELLALTPEDFNFKKKTLRINKSFQRIKSRDVVTTPKTPKSNRVIRLPDFLCEEMKDCLKMFYHILPNDRIFQSMSKHILSTEMEIGCKASGVKKIRIHDLRHSHVSLLINQGFTALDIGQRVGHNSEKITYRYAHMFPTRQDDMAEFLDNARDIREEKEGEENVG